MSRTMAAGVCVFALFLGLLCAAQGAEPNRIEVLFKGKLVGVYFQKDDTPKIKALQKVGLFPDANCLISPASGSKPVPGRFVCDYDCLFERVEFKVPENAPSDLMLVWDKKAFFTGGRCAFFMNFSGKFLTEAEFQKELDKIDAWAAKNAPK